MKRIFILLTTIVSIVTITSITEAIQYDWTTSNEGFMSFQELWSQVDSSWGGALGEGNHSARMVEITGLGNLGSLSEFNTFIDTISSPVSNLNVTIDVFKNSSNGWKAATGQQLPAFNNAFDNAYSSLVMVWMYDGTFQYSFGAELNDTDGWQSNIQLDYLGSRIPSRNPYTYELLMYSDLEVYLQTYQGGDGGTVSYKIDNLSITSAPPVVPEPISSILFIIGGTLLAGRSYLKRRKKA